MRMNTLYIYIFYFLLSSFTKTQDVLILHTIISSLALIAKVDAGDSKGERREKKQKKNRNGTAST